MAADRFAHITTWVFDLDNTLYPAECHLFHQIDARMTAFIEETLSLSHADARKVQKDYYARYGTTLSGLMKEHHIPPKAFMDYVHDIDLAVIKADPALGEAIKTLPGRRVIYTNGSQTHAENVAGKLGILDLFDAIFDVEMAGFTPKPHRPAYEAFWAHLDIDPRSAAMFEDMPQNLEVPFHEGMETVLVQSEAQWFDDEPEGKRPARPGEKYPHVKHVTSDLTQFLLGLTRAPQSASVSL